jgi:hypothetical protein
VISHGAGAFLRSLATTVTKVSLNETGFMGASMSFGGQYIVFETCLEVASAGATVFFMQRLR